LPLLRHYQHEHELGLIDQSYISFYTWRDSLQLLNFRAIPIELLAIREGSVFNQFPW